MNTTTTTIKRNWFIQKMREPSTWAGLSIIGAAFGVPPGTFELFAQLGIAVGGVAAVLMTEQGGQ